MHTAQAALRNRVLNPNGALAGRGGVDAAIASNILIAANAPKSVRRAAPDDTAQVYWSLHTRRNPPEQFVTA
jgi:hypothetical protein